jgi:small subunit ribosomal protein S21
MPEVIVRKGEPVDRALKRLKNKLDSEGIMDEVRRLRAFETPSQKTRRKAKANAKRGKVKFRFNPNTLREPGVQPAGAPAPETHTPAYRS